MNVIKTEIDGVAIIQPKVFADARGFFFESYNARAFRDALGIDPTFVQDNHSRSARNVLRGLHYQVQQPQGKLVRVIVGEILDVAVDIRRSSPTFGRWVAHRLSAENKEMMWVPPGLAHGFAVLSDMAEVLYKTTDYYAPQFERSIRWDDPQLGIDWQLAGEPVLSSKDASAPLLADAEIGG